MHEEGRVLQDRSVIYLRQKNYKEIQKQEQTISSIKTKHNGA